MIKNWSAVSILEFWCHVTMFWHVIYRRIWLAVTYVGAARRRICKQWAVKTMSLVYDDIYEITRDTLGLILWLQNKGVIGYFMGECPRCLEGKITLEKDSSYSKNGFVWRCTKKECGYKNSVRAGSWFERSHLTIQQVIGFIKQDRRQ